MTAAYLWQLTRTSRNLPKREYLHRCLSNPFHGTYNKLARVADGRGLRPAGKIAIRDSLRGIEGIGEGSQAAAQDYGNPRRDAQQGAKIISGGGHLEQHSGDTGRHEIRHGAGRHRFQAKTRQIGLASGRQGADAADLNRYRRKIRKPAKRIGGDYE